MKPADSEPDVPTDPVASVPRRGARVTVCEAYALWARTYDASPNPLVALEERFLEPMLPPLTGKVVVDIGCGTGRWLARLSSRGAGLHLGVDLSHAMLDQAATKPRLSGRLVQADCLRLPLAPAIADVVLCSFVLGYVDVGRLAQEVGRIARNGADLYVSEFHPDGYALGWKRGFRRGDQRVELPTEPYSPEEAAHAFRLHGFDLIQKVEPGFGEPERNIFVAAGKGGVYDSSRGTHALFVCHLQRSDRAV